MENLQRCYDALTALSRSAESGLIRSQVSVWKTGSILPLEEKEAILSFDILLENTISTRIRQNNFRFAPRVPFNLHEAPPVADECFHNGL